MFDDSVRSSSNSERTVVLHTRRSRVAAVALWPGTTRTDAVGRSTALSCRDPRAHADGRPPKVVVVDPNSCGLVGRPPFWTAGTQLMWWSGSGLLAAGPSLTTAADDSVAQNVEPMTVVRDDEEGLVAWLAAGTPVLRVARADGRGKRDDKSTLFTAEPVQAVGEWTGYDVLRVAPAGRRWSVWALFTAHTSNFEGWYVNFEDLHVRSARDLFTRDRVLDLEVGPDGSVARKDEDELMLAVEQGRFDPATAAEIEADATEVEAIVRAWGQPFCDGWERFRPDPTWSTPDLADRTH
jgi:hypothetical protein